MGGFGHPASFVYQREDCHVRIDSASFKQLEAICKEYIRGVGCFAPVLQSHRHVGLVLQVARLYTEPSFSAHTVASTACEGWPANDTPSVTHALGEIAESSKRKQDHYNDSRSRQGESTMLARLQQRLVADCDAGSCFNVCKSVCD